MDDRDPQRPRDGVLDDTAVGLMEHRPPHLPGYRVERLLGVGGTGEVWQVVREIDGERLAAKVVTSGELAEADLLARVRHEHVVRCHEVLDVREQGAVGTVPVLITDLAEGGPLSGVISGRGHLSPGELVTALAPIARTLHDVHGLGLVHADVTGDNILVTAEGKPLLADLGVARVAGCPAEVWGTDGFTAPEVLDGHDPTPAADVYGLGAVAWTALVGSPPEPAALRPLLRDVAPQAGRQLCDLVESCLSHTPDARPGAGDLAVSLWEAAAPEPLPAGVTGPPRPTRPADDVAAASSTSADPAAGLTRRLRARAAADPEPEEPPVWHRQPRVRRTAGAAVVIGVLAGGAAAWTPGAAHPVAGRVKPAAATAPSSNPSAAPPGPSRAPSATSRPAPATGTPARPNLRAVVQQLVDARATAWTNAAPGQLSAGLASGSPAQQRDRADLAAADRSGARYRGLRFTVRSATAVGPVTTGGQQQVRAVIDRASFRLVWKERSQSLPARPGEQALLTLQEHGSSWRISDWKAAR